MSVRSGEKASGEEENHKSGRYSLSRRRALAGSPRNRKQTAKTPVASQLPTLFICHRADQSNQNKPEDLTVAAPRKARDSS